MVRVNLRRDLAEERIRYLDYHAAATKRYLGEKVSKIRAGVLSVVSPEKKRCSRCGATKPIGAFHRCIRSDDGRHPWCAACANRYQAEYKTDNPRYAEQARASLERRKANPEWVERKREYARRYASEHRPESRSRDLKREFGITEADYDKLLEGQHSRCAICGADSLRRRGAKRLAVDHDHVTGKVRGLLCHHCNLGIGALGDDPSLVRAALLYLTRTHNNG